MKYLSFEKLREILKRQEEERFAELKREIRVLRDNIEKFLTKFFESTTSRAQTNYTNLQMY